MDFHHLKLQMSLVFLSAALIGFQLELMQVLALVQWHHFGYMVISIALLGFGASGSCIALFRSWLLPRIDSLLAPLLFCCSMAMALSLHLSQGLISSFDICLLFVDSWQFAFLLLSQFIYFLIFFLGALAIGLIFIHDSDKIGSLYFANLVGSGLGGIAVVAIMYLVLPQQLVVLTALLPWLGGLLVIRKAGITALTFAILCPAIIGTALIFPLSSQPSQYKSISRTLDLPEATVSATRPSPLGLLQLVTAPALRYAPGLSLTYDKEVPTVDGVAFINGEGFGALYSGETSFFRATANALPYIMGDRRQILNLQPGTGADILAALSYQPEKITAVEPNKKIIQLLEEQHGHKSPYAHPSVQFSVLHPRTWLATDRNLYDLITIPTVGSFGGASGLFALREQHLLTIEAFTEIWNHLDEEGLFRVSTWIDTPLRNPLRLAATIAETLEKTGADYRDHVIAIRGWDMVSFVVKRTPLTDDDIDKVSAFCKTYQFDPVFPAEPGNKEYYHSSADSSIITLIGDLFNPVRRSKLYREYDFELRPVTDSRPFFSQFLRYRAITGLVKLFGQRTLPFLELGYFIVLVTLGQMFLAAIFLILLPLLRLGPPGKTRAGWSTIPYFAGLGLGYMFFEMALIHELVLFLGHPIFAVAMAIGSLLIFSGFGSLYSIKISKYRSSKGYATGLIVLILLLYSIILPLVLHRTIGLPMGGKLLVAILLISVPAFIMGMPFPLGLQQVARQSKGEAAWGWGINGSVSVVSTGLATIVAVELGFPTLLLVAAGAYGVASLASWKTG